MKKLNIDNPFFEMMGRFGDIIMVNVLCIVCSLPVITMGAALTAMYQVFWRMEDGTEGRVVGTFWQCFKGNIKRCTPVWIGVLAVGVLLLFDVIFLGYVGMTGVWKVVGVGAGCLLLLWELVFAWAFPMMSKREVRGMEALKGAFRMGVLHLPGTLLMVVFNNVLLICLVMDVYYLMAVLPLYLVFGVGMTGYLNVKIIKRCDRRV